MLAFNKHGDIRKGFVLNNGYGLTYKAEEEEYPLGYVVAFIPIDHLKQLRKTQNPAAEYSKDSEAFRLLEWIIESDNSLGKALGEIPIEAGHTIEILAREIVKLSWLVEDAPQSPLRNGSRFLQELVFWIKDFVAS